MSHAKTVPIQATKLQIRDVHIIYFYFLTKTNVVGTH